MPAIRFDVAVYGIIYGNISRVTVESWQWSTVFQEKGEHKLLEFIEEMNETAEEFIEESTS